jgi:hypothetical protein
LREGQAALDSIGWGPKRSPEALDEREGVGSASKRTADSLMPENLRVRPRPVPMGGGGAREDGAPADLGAEARRIVLAEMEKIVEALHITPEPRTREDWIAIAAQSPMLPPMAVIPGCTDPIGAWARHVVRGGEALMAAAAKAGS